MYHIRQKLNIGTASTVVLPELHTNELGRSFYEQVDQANVCLPDVETTDLRACLDAGVPLKQVSTKLFSPDSVVVDMSPEPQKQQQQQQTNDGGEA